MSDLHDKIVGIIAELCRDSERGSGRPYYKEIYADHTKGFEKKPLAIILVRRGKSLIQNYYPDVWAEYPRGGMDVFEVWHSESEPEAINDIVLPAMVKGIKYLHIVCTGYKISGDKAKELVDLLLNKLHNSRGNYLLPPKNVYIVDIPEKIHKNRAKIESRLSEQLKI